MTGLWPRGKALTCTNNRDPPVVGLMKPKPRSSFQSAKTPRRRPALSCEGMSFAPRLGDRQVRRPGARNRLLHLVGGTRSRGRHTMQRSKYRWSKYKEERFVRG